MRKLHVWVVGLALGAGLPAMPAFAADDADKSEKVERDRVPDAALRALQDRTSPDARNVTYHRVERDGKTLFQVRYDGAGEQKGRAMANKDGTIVGSTGLGDRTYAAAGIPAAPLPLPPAAAPLPAEGRRITAEQARAEIAQFSVEQQRLATERERLAVEVQRLEQSHRDLDARARAGDRAAAEQQAAMRAQRERLLAENERLGVEITRYDQRKRDSAAAGGIPVSDPVLAAGTDRGVAGVAEIGRDRVADDRDFRYQTLAADQVPAAVRDQLGKFTRDGRDVKYRRELNGDRVSYSAHYVLDNGKRYWASVNENGTVRVEPRLSEYQPEDDRARTASDRDRDRPAPAREPAREAARLTRVDQKDVPKEVIQSITRAADKQGGHDWQFFKAGQDDYVVRYQTKDGKAMEGRIDNSGKIVTEPHAVR